MTHTIPPTYDRRILAGEHITAAELAASCAHCGNGPATDDGSPCEHCDGDELTSAQLCDRADVSYRRLDYWTRNGYIVPLVDADGSGSRRLWRRSDVARLRRIARFGELTGRRYDAAVRLLWRTDPARGIWLAQRCGVFLHYENRPADSIPSIWLPAEVA